MLLVVNVLISTHTNGVIEARFNEARALFEKQFLRRKLEECRGNVSLLAEKIGLERSHLSKKLKSYGLEAKKDG